MSSSSTLPMLVGAIFLAVVGAFLLSPSGELPANSKVNEHNFVRLKMNMPEQDVSAIFGEPHKRTCGERVWATDSISGKQQFYIEDRASDAAVDVLYVYQGKDGEQIRLLLSRDTRQVIGAQYCLSEEPLCYHGCTTADCKPRTAVSASLTGVSEGNSADKKDRRSLLKSFFENPLVHRTPAIEVTPGSVTPALTADTPEAVPDDMLTDNQTPYAEPLPVQGETAGSATNQSIPGSVTLANAGIPGDFGAMSTAGGRRPANASLKISLPSGKFLDLKSFKREPLMVREWFTHFVIASKRLPGSAPAQPLHADVNMLAALTSLDSDFRFDPWSVIQLKYSTGSPFVFASHEKGVLSGLTVAFYNNQADMALVYYDRGERHGFMQTFNPQGQEVYWCQYNKGKRDGFCCFFDNGALRIVCQCADDEVESIHLIADDQVEKSFASMPLAHQDMETAGELDKMTKIETEMAGNEEQLKTAVKERFKAFQAEIIRQNRLQSRQEASYRASQLRSSNNAAMRSFRNKWGINIP